MAESEWFKQKMSDSYKENPWDPSSRDNRDNNNQQGDQQKDAKQKS